MEKAPNAYRTIGEVAAELNLPQHVLRFWETRFTRIRPIKRAGGRRYYRPRDIVLLRGIRHLLYEEGYTIKGVQRIFRECGVDAVAQAHLPRTDDAQWAAAAQAGADHILPGEAMPEGGAMPDLPQLDLGFPGQAARSDGPGAGIADSPAAGGRAALKRARPLRLVTRLLGSRPGDRPASDPAVLHEVMAELLECKRLLDRQAD